jgi:PIN domain nuclease of toxin-antitoxin system
VILLDTHVIHWSAVDDLRLGPKSRALIEATADGDRLLSVASLWEMGVHIRRKRLRPPLQTTLEQLCRGLLQNGYRSIAIDAAVVLKAEGLMQLHEDPADRFIVATAVLTGATLLTSDRKILRWPGRLDRLDAET